MKRDDLEAFGADSYPDVAAMHEERRELFRIAAVSALANGGAHLQPADRAWSEHWARVKPLGRPVGTGEPK